MVDLKTVVVTKKNITLTWADPLDNGGSDIIGYEVLRKDAKMKLFRQPIETASCKCDIQGLLAGEEYDFRVVARNKYGDGAPADIGPILAEDPKGIASLFFRKKRHHNNIQCLNFKLQPLIYLINACVETNWKMLCYQAAGSSRPDFERNWSTSWKTNP